MYLSTPNLLSSLTINCVSLKTKYLPLSGGGPVQATLLGKGWFQGDGAWPATKWGIWNMTDSLVMGHGPIGNVPLGTAASDRPDDPSGKAGRWFTRPGRSADQRVDTVQADTCVLPYKARNFRRPPGRPTRVQGLGVGGGLSNPVHLDLKSGGSTHYRTVSASTWVPRQLPAPLDTATFRIGQLSTGYCREYWTVAGTKSDSCPAVGKRAGRDGWGGAGGPGWRSRRS